MSRTTNRQARRYVERRQPFRGSNCFGERVGDGYVVYSYGRHWPLYIWLPDGGWYENSSSYSVSTSRHRSQLRPLEERGVPVSRHLMPLPGMMELVEQLLHPPQPVADDPNDEIWGE